MKQIEHKTSMTMNVRRKFEQKTSIAMNVRRKFLIVLFLVGVALCLIQQIATARIVATYNFSNEGQLERSDYSHCPLAVRNAQGVYKDPQKGDAFSQVVLLTAANWAYFDLLQNWQALANRLGLKYAVLAMDDRIQNELGPASSVPSNHGWTVNGSQRYGSSDFKKLACNKLVSVLNVMEACQVDVVFSDVDNVFFKDPLDHEFGKMIKSKQFDYVYQTYNVTDNKPRSHTCITKGELPREGNTGFYYVSHSSGAMRKVFETAIEMCSTTGTGGDDQQQKLFWRAVHLVPSAHHCTEHDFDGGFVKTPSNSSVRFCCLDPYYYPLGNERNPSQDAVTYHANWVTGKARKIALLRRLRIGVRGWAASRIDQSKMNETL